MNLMMSCKFRIFYKPKIDKFDKADKKMAPRVGLEPTTWWLTATRSAD